MPTCGILNRRSAAEISVRSASSWPGSLPARCCWRPGGAIACRVNLPLSVALVWLSNLFTMPPMFYGAYLTGCQLQGNPPGNIEIEFTWAWLVSVFRDGGPAALAGLPWCSPC